MSREADLLDNFLGHLRRSQSQKDHFRLRDLITPLTGRLFAFRFHVVYHHYRLLLDWRVPVRCIMAFAIGFGAGCLQVGMRREVVDKICSFTCNASNNQVGDPARRTDSYKLQEHFATTWMLYISRSAL